MGRSVSFNVDVDLTVEVCWVCGITFAMDRRWANKRSSLGKCFYCPAGCKLSYGEGEVARLKRQLQKEEEKVEREKRRVERERGWHEQTQRRLSATKGVVTRFRNRIANGTCPCCKEQFKNLQDHMESEHPDYESQDPETHTDE